MTPVSGDTLVEATWCGPFVGEFTDGTTAQPGDVVQVPAAEAVTSGHFETDAELVASTELPGPEVALTEEQLNSYNLGDLAEIAGRRDIIVTEGTGVGNRVLKADIIGAILAAQAAAPTGAGDQPPAGAGRPDDGGGE